MLGAPPDNEVCSSDLFLRLRSMWLAACQCSWLCGMRHDVGVGNRRHLPCVQYPSTHHPALPRIWCPTNGGRRGNVAFGGCTRIKAHMQRLSLGIVRFVRSLSSPYHSTQPLAFGRPALSTHQALLCFEHRWAVWALTGQWMGQT